MTNYKKILLIGILIFSTIIFLGACQGSNANTGSSEDSGEASGDITVWAWDLEADYLQSIVAKFNEEYPDINVEINKQGPDDVFQRLVTGLASGQTNQLPDLVQIQDTDIPSFLNKFPEAFTNLSDMGFTEYEGNFVDVKSKMVKDNEERYIAFPRDVGPVGVFYRKDIFEEAGIDAASIKTWDDYIEAGNTIKEQTGTAMLGLTLNEHIPLARFMIHQQGAFYFDEEGGLNLGSEETLKALEKLKEITDSGIVENVTNSEGLTAAVKNGNVATVPNSVWYNGTLMSQAPELSGEWGVFPLPTFDGSSVSAANSGGSSFAIPEGSDNKRAAYLFGEFIATNVDNQITALEDFGLFPSLVEAYETSQFSEGQEYFGGDNIYDQFAKIAVETPEVTYTGDYPEVNNAFNEEIASMILNDEDPKEVIDRLIGRVEASTGTQDVNK